MKANRVSTTQLAEICGVSQGTVDRALNNRKGINLKTKERILEVAREYGYHPELYKGSRANEQTVLIGVVVFDLNDQGVMGSFADVYEHLIEKGCSPVVMLSNQDAKREIECIKNLSGMSVDGIVIYPVNNGEAFERFLKSLRLPVVTIGTRLENIPYADMNDRSVMYKLIDRMLREIPDV